MESESILLLVMLYLCSGLTMSICVIANLRRNPQQRYFNVVSWMYIFIYAVVPVLVHSYCYMNGTQEHAYAALDYSAGGIKYFFAAWILSIVGFIGLKFGHVAVLRSKHLALYDRRESYTVEHSYMTWFISAIICLVIGLISEFLWTRAYGGMIGILRYSSDLRSGYNVGITNSFTVFKRFVPLVQFANVVLWALFMKYRKLAPLVMSIPALVLSILYLLANDGRAPLVMHLVALLWIFIKFKDKRGNDKKLSLAVVVPGIIFTLFLIHNSDQIVSMFFAGNGRSGHLSFDIFSSVRTEFAFTVRSGQSIFKYLDEHPFSFRFPLECLNGVLGVLPSGFRPEWLEKLEVLNTRYWTKGISTLYYGGKPPDLIVTGLYTLNYFGAFLLPMMLGGIVKKIDNRSQRLSRRLDYELFFALILYPLIRVVGYTNFDGITLSFFYIFVGYLIVHIVGRARGDDLVLECSNGKELSS